MGRSVLDSWIEADKRHREFAELVRKMREVQEEIDCLPTYESNDKLEREKDVLQKEVDAQLKQMGYDIKDSQTR